MQFSRKNNNITGICQKIYQIASDEIVLWAGSKLYSRIFIQEIIQNRSNGLSDNIAKLLKNSQLDGKQIQEFSCINIRFVSGEIINDYHNCSDETLYGKKLISDGSGKWYFFDRKNPAMGDNKSRSPLLFSRIGRNIYLEGLNVNPDDVDDGLPFDYFYGGWMDVFFSHPLGFFFRVQYGIKIWEFDGHDLVDDLPYMFSTGSKHGLTLHIIDKRPLAPTYRHIKVPTILDPSPSDDNYDSDMAFEINVIYKKDTSNTLIGTTHDKQICNIEQLSSREFDVTISRI